METARLSRASKQSTPPSYPRQFATLNLMFTKLFTLLVPFGMLGEFAKLGDGFIWLTIPFSALVA